MLESKGSFRAILPGNFKSFQSVTTLVHLSFALPTMHQILWFSGYSVVLSCPEQTNLNPRTERKSVGAYPVEWLQLKTIDSKSEGPSEAIPCSIQACFLNLNHHYIQAVRTSTHP